MNEMVDEDLNSCEENYARLLQIKVNIPHYFLLLFRIEPTYVFHFDKFILLCYAKFTIQID